MIAPVPDGPRWDPWAARADETLTVYGLALRVDPEELRTVSRQVRNAGAEVAAALDAAQRAAAAIDTTSPHAPGSGARATEAIQAARYSRSGLPDSLTHLADELLEAHRRYLEAELAANSSAVIGPAFVPGGPICAAPPVVTRGSVLAAAVTLPAAIPYWLVGGVSTALAESIRNGRVTPSAAQVGRSLRMMTHPVTLGVLPPESSAHVFASMLTQVTTGKVTSQVRVKRVPPPPRRRARMYRGPGHPGLAVSQQPTTNLEGLVEGIGELYPKEGADPGTVRVDRMVAPDGSISWQVFIPGTQTADAPWGGPVPNDWASNLQIYSRQESAASAAVIAAMRAAGIGAGEPVLLAGHSQGGLVASDLAARQEVQAEFSIDSVLSVGAPVSHIDVPEGVAALHLEHEDDLVAGVDDGVNPISGNRTTVQRDVTANRSGFWPPSGVWESHDVPAYTETARLADASTNPAVRNWFTASAAMLHSEASVTSTYVRATRVP